MVAMQIDICEINVTSLSKTRPTFRLGSSRYNALLK
jgi:hypothetical protein